MQTQQSLTSDEFVASVGKLENLLKQWDETIFTEYFMFSNIYVLYQSLQSTVRHTHKQLQ